MSGRNWLSHPFVGVGLALVLIVAVGSLLAGHNPDAEPVKTTANQQGQTAPNKRPKTGSALAPTEPKPNPNPNRQEWRSERDLQAQRDMAKWTLVAALAAVGGIGVGIVGLAFVYSTLKETRNAVKEAAVGTKAAQDAVLVAERTLVAMQRPWLSIKVERLGTLVFSDGDG